MSDLRWQEWTIPRLNTDTGKWIVNVIKDGQVIETHEFDDEQSALDGHKEMFLDAVMNDRDMSKSNVKQQTNT
jgi:hypothetical protein